MSEGPVQEVILNPESLQESILEARETIFIDGFGLVDALTGEIIEIEGSETFKEEDELSEEEVEWALGKLFRLDGEIVAHETRLKSEIDAITKNWKPSINRLQGAKEGFLRWIKPSLERYAGRALSKMNTKADGTPKANPSKSVKFPKGSLGFRTIPKTVIASPERSADVRIAIDWCRSNYAGALDLAPVLALDKLESEEIEMIRAVTAGEMTWEDAGWTGPCPLKVTLPGEKFDVKTGVKA
jgi:hypothetical protein